MAKSIRSKWKRKMRAIKRVGMDEKVLIRMKKMLAEHEKEQKEEALEKIREEKTKSKEQKIELIEGEVTEEAEETEAADEPARMEVEGAEPKEAGASKKREPSIRKMKNSDNKYPAWMSTQKIKRHCKMLKKKEKRGSKFARMGRQWKLANA